MDVDMGAGRCPLLPLNSSRALRTDRDVVAIRSLQDTLSRIRTRD
jgi:hypothetical protein